MIKKIKVVDNKGNEKALVDVGQVDPRVASQIAINAKGNLEITAPTGLKTNLIADKGVQIKVGMKDASKAGELAIDNELNTADPFECKIHACNGRKTPDGSADLYVNDTIGVKLNVAELVLDTKKANETKFDGEELNIKACNDKFSSHPIYVKHKARAFDFRCYDHGGIALQIAGADHNNTGQENKIKFESARIVPFTDSEGNVTIPTTCKKTDYFVNKDNIVEGGKGFEFGTFNNLHTSLFTGDYRFNGKGRVYAAKRDVVYLDENGDEMTFENGITPTGYAKVDYRTQADDFKDVIDSSTKSATWEDIVGVATAWVDSLRPTALGGSSSGSGEGTPADHTWEMATNKFLDKETAAVIYALKTEIPSGPQDAPNQAALNTLSVNDKGNVVFSTVGMLKADSEQTAYNAYIAAKATYDALPEEEKANTAAPAVVEPAPASLDIAGSKLAIKSTNLEVNSSNIVIPFEISKKGKFTLCGTELEEGTIDKDSSIDDVKRLLTHPTISIRVDKNNIGAAKAQYKNDALAAALPEGTDLISVSLYDLLTLVDRVKALEKEVKALKGE